MVQIARPNGSNDPDGVWNIAGGSASFHAATSDLNNSTSIYQTTFDFSPHTIQLDLDNTITSPSDKTNHKVAVSGFYDGFSPDNFTLSLYENTTSIASQILSMDSTSPQEKSFTLSTTEANSITNYDNLNIRITYTYGGSVHVKFTEAWLEVPDAGGGGGEGPKLHPEFFIMLL